MTLTYALSLRLEDIRCVVVGAGRVAARKVHGLLEAGADVHVIAPHRSEAMPDHQRLSWHDRPYRRGDLQAARLAFACTDDPVVNRSVADEAVAIGIWCNVADDPDRSTCHVPATLRRGGLQIAVGTEGAGPRLATAVRDRLDSQFGPEYATLTEELARARSIVRQRVADAAVRRAIFETLCAECSIKLLARRDRQAWRDWFERVLEHRVRRGRGEPPAADDV